jgi:hypothetical protein
MTPASPSASMKRKQVFRRRDDPEYNIFDSAIPTAIDGYTYSMVDGVMHVVALSAGQSDHDTSTASDLKLGIHISIHIYRFQNFIVYSLDMQIPSVKLVSPYSLSPISSMTSIS